MRRLFMIVVVAAIVAGCGGSGGSVLTSQLPTSSPTVSTSQGATSPPSSEKSVTRAVKAYLYYFLTGNVNGTYRKLSSTCRSRFTKKRVKTLLQEAHANYGGNVKLTSLTVEELNGPNAYVNYTMSVSKFNATAQNWIYQNGGWRLNTC
jgi:hypothetical protein